MRDKNSPQHLLLNIIIALIVVFGGTVAVVTVRQHQHAANKAATTTQHSTAPKSSSPASISYAGRDGQSALALLKTHGTVVTKDSSYGPYVDSINGVAGGTNGKYWTFYVNGKAASVGADAYITKSTDTITWKFQ